MGTTGFIHIYRYPSLLFRLSLIVTLLLSRYLSVGRFLGFLQNLSVLCFTRLLTFHSEVMVCFGSAANDSLMLLRVDGNGCLNASNYSQTAFNSSRVALRRELYICSFSSSRLYRYTYACIRCSNQ